MRSQKQREPIASEELSPLVRFLKKLPKAPFPSTVNGKVFDSKNMN
ncbi:hypothetical protein VFMJ11_B0013 (plasmid) [Aliivibrio fischeri MJ11]|uniref:Uncharacterized protein n=1 Tax=Aliivibrio fischeri (strain MJ11) TaxID=388396 RepID=B5EVV6_ALIFM|nr:hypothetical protein VFMJ11_B0013 [Aliivibrio fischeri MJ11]